jgi:hypothetical protein
MNPRKPRVRLGVWKLIYPEPTRRAPPPPPPAPEPPRRSRAVRDGIPAALLSLVFAAVCFARGAWGWGLVNLGCLGLIALVVAWERRRDEDR